MSVLSCCLWNSAPILPSSGDDILIFPVENFPFPMGAPAPRSGSRRLRPDVTRMCQPLCYNDWLRANGKFLKWLEWEGVRACVCVYVFSQLRGSMAKKSMRSVPTAWVWTPAAQFHYPLTKWPWVSHSSFLGLSLPLQNGARILPVSKVVMGVECMDVCKACPDVCLLKIVMCTSQT